MACAGNRRGGGGGFTLLEVLLAVAILAISLTSLLSSQMAALRATRYARGVSVAAFLAESKLIDIEWELRKDGWGDNDKEFEGDFSEEGWPDARYTCLVDMIELPDYTALQAAVDAAETDGSTESVLGVQDAEDRAFDSLGMVWPVVKGAVERSIRKASCTIYWKDGNIDHDFEVTTFWTNPQALTELPGMGGEQGEEDDVRGGGAGGGGGSTGRGGAGGRTPSGRGGIGGAGGPVTPPGARGGGRG